MADLFLQPRMTVIPIGARLPDRKFIGEGLARRDAGETDAGHAVHVKRQDQPVPVDRTILVRQPVGDVIAPLRPFLQLHERAGEEWKGTRLISSHYSASRTQAPA